MEDKNTNIYTQLKSVQSELKVPKNNYNSFGKYRYRSAEGILESVKPLLKKYDLTLIISDSIELLGNRFYVCAECTLYNAQGHVIKSKGYAREEENKKGMDASQITGSTSSYARKYALNGLFGIDDNKDADALNTSKENTEESKEPYLENVLGAISQATDMPSLVAIWNANPALQSNKTFTSKITSRKKEIS